MPGLHTAQPRSGEERSGQKVRNLGSGATTCSSDSQCHSGMISSGAELRVVKARGALERSEINTGFGEGRLLPGLRFVPQLS